MTGAAVTVFLTGVNVDFLYYVLQAYMPDVSLVPLKALAMGLLALSLLLGCHDGGLRRLRTPYQIWFLAVLVYSGCMAVIGFARGNGLAAIAVDMWTVTYLAGVLVGARRRAWRALDVTMVVHYVIGLGLLVPSFAELDFDVARSVRTIHVSYRLSGLLYPWLYAVVRAESGGRGWRVLAYGGLSVFLLSAVVAEKRAYFVQLALGLALLFVTELRRSGWRLERAALPLVRPLLALVTVGAVVLALLASWDATRLQLLGGLADATMQRFVHEEATGEEIGLTETAFGDYRWNEEVIYVVAGATPLELAGGRGFGTTVEAQTQESGRTLNVHNGLLHLVLKGGGVFLTLYLSAFIPLIARLALDPSARVDAAVAVLVVNVVSIPFQNIFSPSLTFLLLLLCLGRIASREVGDPEPGASHQGWGAAAARARVATG